MISRVNEILFHGTLKIEQVVQIKFRADRNFDKTNK